MTRPKATPAAFANLTETMRAAQQPAQDNAPPQARSLAQGDAPAAKRSATRQNTKLVQAHLPQATHRALRLATAAEGITMQDMLEEALHDWLVKKGATKHLNP